MNIENTGGIDLILSEQQIRYQGSEGVTMTSLPGSSMYYNDNAGMRGATVVNKDGSTIDFVGVDR